MRISEAIPPTGTDLYVSFITLDFYRFLLAGLPRRFDQIREYVASSRSQ